MRREGVLLTLMIGLAPGVTAAGPGVAAEQASAEKVAHLIERLGSAEFEEREGATRELEKIGPPALGALRKARQGDDAEVRRRAEELVHKIEKQADAERLLAPTRVRLAFQKTPVKDAVAELARQSGYAILLHDPQDKVGDRAITLDTGETTFWEAFNRLCAKAGLVEGNAADLNVPSSIDSSVSRPAVPTPPANAPARRLLERLLPAKPLQVQEEAPAPEGPEGLVCAEATGPGPAAVRPAGAGDVAAAAPNMPVPQIVLVDGKAENWPTCYAGAVRIRALPSESADPWSRGEGFPLRLEASPEPKLHWDRLLHLRIHKADDDRGQALEEILPVPPGDLPAGVVATRRILIHRESVPCAQAQGSKLIVPFHLQRPDRKPTSLRDLRGVVSVQFRTPAETVLSAADPLRAVGKVVPGENGGSLTVLGAKRGEGGKLNLRVALEYPPDFPPPGHDVHGGGGMMPGPVPAPVPVNALPNGPGALPAGAAGPAVAPVAMPVYRPESYGLQLLDDKGKALELHSSGCTQRRAGGALTHEIHLTYRLDKGQGDPARLTFSGSRPVALDIPFTLKDVPLP